MTTVEQRFTFDEIGDLYDRYRPGYPEALFEDLLSLSGISPSDRILEIGCGTGQATLPFAQRGYTMSCLEPGPRLASIARGNLAEFSDIGVVCETFEAWPCELSAFGLVFSAQAFHWLPPELRFTKSAEALRPGGSLAVIGNAVVVNRTPHGDAGGSLGEALDDAYARYAPSIQGPPVTRWYAEEGPIPELFSASACFGAVVARRYPWSYHYNTSDYLGLMKTHSDHRLLPAEQRGRLHEAIGQALEGSGGGIEVFYEANLYVAKRAA
ncbi:MAG TPA: class I SAM-dependent methyltransferase [Myxococcales bacterium]|nr:class I SAM-dependent methyltransferase [Myxococcales bacterium]HIL80536.1 class I SAM-dependent methyltransferase [Myxococcales bacterium]